MSINNVLSEVVTALGLKDTEVETLKKSREGLDASIKNNQDKLNLMIDEIQALEAQIKIKKKNYENCSKLTQTILGRELRTLLGAYKRKEEEINLIADRIDKNSLLHHKLGILIFYAENPTKSEEIEDTLVDLDLAMKETEKENNLSDKLSNTTYNSNTTNSVSVDNMYNEFETKKDNDLEAALADFE
ncbi:MAG: hypothetical protein IKB16_00050 [Lentisphaeria bacterium]|nr:hypothetical protein [Lentisphaeria bacterium]